MSGKPQIRCAIYTRKSTEEGLEQAFNSLDAQYEACAAYVASQKHEGWKLVPQRYDDGGISGGTLERPALQRLLADIDAGRIGMVIVYKIDRLTRSLADFARLVERLEAGGCSFVSATQAFNTSTSMGRLTLNVLLSFAQFEREVTAERIRDKIAASKRKGLWMGGTVPLGYDAHPDPTRRELVVNPAEAEVVLTLFTLYDELTCLNRVQNEATRRGLRSKLRVSRAGTVRGGNVFSRGQIYHLLTNPTYLGRIRHREKTFPGQHPAIVPEDLWTRVQEKLTARSARRRGAGGREGGGREAGARNGTGPALLLGKVRDEEGDPLTPTHAQKRGRRYRYYVSHRLIADGTDATGWRLPAPAFENLVADCLARQIEDHATAHRLSARPEAATAAALAARGTELAATLRAAPDRHLAQLLRAGHIARDRLSLQPDEAALATALGLPPDDLAPDLAEIAAPLTLRRRGVEARLISGSIKPAPDRTLIRTLAQAHRWTALLREGLSFVEIARREGKDESFVRARAQLVFLAPAIQTRILEGTLPPEITLERLVRNPLPLDWAEQARGLGL